MSETSEQPTISSRESKIPRVLQKLAKRVTVENIDPRDKLLKLSFPKIIEEHLARYNQVAKIAQKYFPDNYKLTVIDTACGRGYGTDILKKLFPDGKVLGVDLQLNYTSKAHKKYPQPQFVTGDVTKIPVSADAADILTAFEITEHLPQESQTVFFKEIFRVLKPGGVAILSIPFPYSFEKTKTGATKRAGPWTNLFHLHEPGDQETQQLFTDVGLTLKNKLGQIIVKPELAEKAKALNKILPVWPIFAWHPGRKTEVVPIPERQLALTNIYVLQKPAILQS